MTAEQTTAWFATANWCLTELKGPLDFWGQTTPMPVQFCDGHGVHQMDLQELRQALVEAKEQLQKVGTGEDGPAFGVSPTQIFVEICAIIANSRRVVI